MEKVIAAEIDKLCDVLGSGRRGTSATSSAAGATSLSQLLSVSVVNSIWTILTGEKISHGDTTVNEIIRGTDK